MNRSNKRPIVFAIRDFPSGCGSLSNISLSDLPEKATKKIPRTTSDHHVASLRQEPDSENPDLAYVVTAPNDKGTSSLRTESEIRNPAQDPTPREKVLDVLHHFDEVFRQLERDKRCGIDDSLDSTSRIDLKTQAVLERMGKKVNTEKRIGSVPGINIGDVFQYKTALRLVGLHFRTMSGIDYMKIGDTKLATSIVSSEGYGYNDKFEEGVVVYTGEGGNVMGKEKKYEDQKMVNGNLALANSMREKSEVRVIRGEERWDHKGKRYVYDGLYLVDKYWLEKGVSGMNVFKFKLCRIPGQPSLT